MKNLPNEYLLLRHPQKVCEVVFTKNGSETVLFAGGRVAAKKFLGVLRCGIAWESVRAFCHKENGRGGFEEFTAK